VLGVVERVTNKDWVVDWELPTAPLGRHSA
jgi:hypothetical protein